MTPSQKAEETRRKHRENQDRKYKEGLALKAKLRETWLSIIDSEEATTAEKLEASKLLTQFL